MKKSLCLLCLLALLALLPAGALADRAYLVDSDVRLITEAELWEWDRESLSFMFNEIFARHGFTFDAGGKFYNWFNSQPWYQALAKVDDRTAYDRTTTLEWKNYKTIKKVIAEMDAVKWPYRKAAGSALKSWIDFQPPGQWSLTGFSGIQLKAGQKLEVYSAPSRQAWRGADGKASVSTNGGVWAAGWESGWLQIFYEVSKGGLRVGYVEGSKISGKADINVALNFARVPVQVLSACTLTDDPLRQVNTITTLRAGSTVTYLTTATNQYGQAWDYVETQVNGKTARGYVPAGCLGVPQETVPDLDDWYK